MLKHAVLVLLLAWPGTAHALAPETPASAHEDIDFLLFEGELFLQDGRLEEAISTLARVVEIAPERMEGHLLYARALTSGLLTGGLDDPARARSEAESHFKWVLDREPRHPEAVRGLRLLVTHFPRTGVSGLRTEEGRAAWEEGWRAIGEGDLTLAIEALRRAALAEADAPMVHTTLGETLREAGRAAEAMEAFSRALELQSDNPEAHAGTAAVLEEKGESEAALSHFQQAFDLAPSLPPAFEGIIRILGSRDPESLSPEDRSLLGRAHLAADRYDEAAALLEASLAEKPDPVAKKALGIVEFFRGNDERAVDLLRGIEADGFTDPELFYYLGAVHLRQGRVEKGRDYLRKVIEADDDSPQALRLLGLSLADEPESSAEALEFLLRAERAGADIDGFSCLLGTLYMRLMRPHEAKVSLTDCLRRNPDHPGAHLSLGILADDWGETRDAIAHLRRYLELEPEPELSAIFRLAVAYLRSGQDEEGFETLRLLVKSDQLNLAPDSTEVSDIQLLEMTSYFLASVRRFEDAIFIGETLLTHDTENPIYNNNLAMTYADANRNLGRAHSLARKAVRLDPDNPGHLDTLGWALVRLERLEEAEQTLLRSVEILQAAGRDDLSEIYYHLGYLYRLLDRDREAEEYLALALENPPTPYLRSEIERLIEQDPAKE